MLCLDRREGGSCTSCCCRGTWRRRRQCVTVARFHSWPDSNFDSAALIDPCSQPLLLPHSSKSSYGLFAGNFVPPPLISRNLSARNLQTPSLSAYWPGWAAAGAPLVRLSVPLSLAAGEGERREPFPFFPHWELLLQGCRVPPTKAGSPCQAGAAAAAVPSVISSLTLYLSLRPARCRRRRRR